MCRNQIGDQFFSADAFPRFLNRDDCFPDFFQVVQGRFHTGELDSVAADFDQIILASEVLQTTVRPQAPHISGIKEPLSFMIRACPEFFFV